MSERPSSKSNDLRIVKTKRAIYKAFNELLLEKTLDRITVTELAKRAEINKGTFYLHYADIYELYQMALKDHIHEMVSRITFFPLMCSDPSKFARTLITKANEKHPSMKEDPYFSRSNGQWGSFTISYFTDELVSQALQQANLPNNVTNRTKLEFMFSGIGTLLRTQNDVDLNTKVRIISSTVQSLFLQ